MPALDSDDPAEADSEEPEPDPEEPDPDCELGGVGEELDELELPHPAAMNASASNARAATRRIDLCLVALIMCLRLVCRCSPAVLAPFCGLAVTSPYPHKDACT
ncbi:MAG TPA: hypothetical protein VIC05_06085 [Solirubrobacteraceae bacterium]